MSAAAAVMMRRGETDPKSAAEAAIAQFEGELLPDRRIRIAAQVKHLRKLLPILRSLPICATLLSLREQGICGCAHS